jgi:hypothetical protein
MGAELHRQAADPVEGVAEVRWTLLPYQVEPISTRGLAASMFM